MVYTRVWDETAPLGTELANTLDTIIQHDKTDTRERVAGIFGLSLGEFTADPIVPKSLSLSVGYTGNVTGNVTGNITGNLTGSVLTAAQGNITSLGTLTGLTLSGSITSTGANFFSVRQYQLDGWNLAKYAGGVLTLGGNAAEFTSAVIQANGVTIATFAAAGLAATLTTAAQPNITSLGSIASLVTSGVNALVNNTQTTNYVVVALTNTGGSSYFGAETSVGGVLFTGSAAYATVLGATAARSLQLATSGTVRQTIDSAGNVVFTGTVTAANFVGPTSIDANNLTGTTLNAGVIHSSLTDLGTLTSLLTSVAPVFTVARTSGANATVLTLVDTVTGVQTVGFGTRINGTSNTGASVSAIAFEVGGTGTNNESQLAFYTQISSGSLVRQMTIRSNGQVDFVGTITANLTGTILTAAQANITSLGTLTSLNVSGTATFTALTNFQPVSGGEAWRVSYTADPTNYQLKLTQDNYVGGVVRHIFSQINAGSTISNVLIMDQGRVLFGTTSLTGVTAGGIHAAGNSVFDGSVTAASFSGPITGNLTGTIQTAAQPNITSVGTLGATVFNSTVSGITTLTATTVVGNLTGTINTSAQGNITSLGTLTSLSISGTLTQGTSHIAAGTSTSVTGATTIYTTVANTGVLMIVFGSDGTNAFCDLVMCGSNSSNVTVISQHTITLTPAGRTYSIPSGVLKLAMASGTYTVKTMPLYAV